MEAVLPVVLERLSSSSVTPAGERSHTPRTIAKAVTHTFNDYSLTWDNTGKSCYYA